MIEKIVIHNYKLFDDFELALNKDLNIIVGNNEAGKSTILEAINLALTKRLNGRFIENELSSYIFNKNSVAKYFTELNNNKNPVLPTIFIELYLSNSPEFASLKGTNNSKRENKHGIRLEIIFDDDFKKECEQYLKDRTKINTIPIEYYKVIWRSFADSAISARSLPINLSFIDATSIRLLSGTDYYLQNIINNGLDIKERVALSIAYRKLKEDFSGQNAIKAINNGLDSKKGAITDKKLAISVDISQKTNWETNLVPHLDELPFQFAGSGEQNSLKILLALERKAKDVNIILIEEPENHLSFLSMNKLLDKIVEKCKDKQIIIATHSSFVLNKLGLDKLILISNTNKAFLKTLEPETQKYFKKLSGFDTLRLILASKAILVEGPSDELIVQKAYMLNHGGKLPIHDGIDVISVGLSFKRFLEIAKKLNINVSVVTDNDSDYKHNIELKYKDYFKSSNIKIFYDKDNNANTLEPQIIKNNNLAMLNEILEENFPNLKLLEDYMCNNKTECALKFFETDKKFNIPQYINDAVR